MGDAALYIVSPEPFIERYRLRERLDRTSGLLLKPTCPRFFHIAKNKILACRCQGQMPWSGDFPPIFKVSTWLQFPKLSLHLSLLRVIIRKLIINGV
jgi:hypothetical protein